MVSFHMVSSVRHADSGKQSNTVQMGEPYVMHRDQESLSLSCNNQAIKQPLLLTLCLQGFSNTLDSPLFLIKKEQENIQNLMIFSKNDRPRNQNTKAFGYPCQIIFKCYSKDGERWRKSMRLPWIAGMVSVFHHLHHTLSSFLFPRNFM